MKRWSSRNAPRAFARASLPPLLPTLLLLLLLLLLLPLLSGCGDDGGNDRSTGTTGPTTPANDITAFAGPWLIHRAGSTQLLSCTDGCEAQTQRLLDRFFAIVEADSVCVQVDSLRHLLLVEPFASAGQTSGSVIGQNASLEHQQVLELDGDSLSADLRVDVILGDGGMSLDAFYTVQVQQTSGDDCASCRALVGMAGNRRLSGDCE